MERVPWITASIKGLTVTGLEAGLGVDRRAAETGAQQETCESKIGRFGREGFAEASDAWETWTASLRLCVSLLDLGPGHLRWSSRVSWVESKVADGKAGEEKLRGNPLVVALRRRCRRSQKCVDDNLWWLRS